MTLSEVAKITDLNPAVARRCLITLSALGYIGKEGSFFMLRPAVLELSTPFIESFNIDNVIRPPLQKLRDETGDSASFAVLMGGDVLYITHVSTYRVIRLQATTGTRFPALVTSLGRAILSALPEQKIIAFISEHPITATTQKTIVDPVALENEINIARTRGFSLVSDELDYGVTSIACPVCVPGYGIVGAINSSASTGSVALDTFASSRLPALLAVRDQLVEELSGSPDLIHVIRSATN
mgnify:CR=1 FL=1